MGQKLDRYLETHFPEGNRNSSAMTSCLSSAKDVYEYRGKTLEISEDDFVIGYMEGWNTIVQNWRFAIGIEKTVNQVVSGLGGSS